MRTLVIFLVLIGLAGAIYFFVLPPAIEARAQPTPTPRPASSIAGMGDGATLLGPSQQTYRVGTPGEIVPQTTPPPKHH